MQRTKIIGGCKDTWYKEAVIGGNTREQTKGVTESRKIAKLITVHLEFIKLR
jgi:hypothetical protein